MLNPRSGCGKRWYTNAKEAAKTKSIVQDQPMPPTAPFAAISGMFLTKHILKSQSIFTTGTVYQKIESMIVPKKPAKNVKSSN